ncbi:hypothetical protein TWF970_006492 [Orbilia oligospora]|uniref:Uncharacterized protein n=1 Tax=Orbilia oligospora TaxID=2813651 RepID=A0A7C8VC28_ORBOL|nr:hypothetical protein TWF970_006492 [Orbilia oligospora]
MSLTIQKLFENFIDQEEPEAIELCAELELLEDNTTKMKTMVFAFFQDYIQELKNSIGAPNDAGYPLKMKFLVPATKKNVFMEDRKCILNTWSFGYWNQFSTIKKDIKILCQKYDDIADAKRKFSNRLSREAAARGITFDSYLKDLGILEMFGKFKKGMRTIYRKLAPAAQRFGALQIVALKAKALMWRIFKGPKIWKTKKSTGSIEWEFTIRLNVDWANELGRLNTKLTDDRISKANDLADSRFPVISKFKQPKGDLKILKKIFGCIEEGTQTAGITNHGREPYALDIIGETLAELSLAKFLDDIDNGRLNLFPGEDSESESPQTCPKTPENALATDLSDDFESMNFDFSDNFYSMGPLSTESRTSLVSSPNSEFKSLDQLDRMDLD